MPDLFVGIDSGTSGTRVVVAEGERGRVVAAASAPHELIAGLPPGHKEQHPGDWVAALDRAVSGALAAPGVDRTGVRALGVSGQQHGLVALDAERRVIRPAKLWCDVSTAAEGLELVRRAGGPERFRALTGNGCPPGFTASKLLWLKEREPESWRRLRTVLLPHDYLNLHLTGRMVMEPGDASGTALFDVRARAWCEEVARAIDPALMGLLPPLHPGPEPIGALRAELARGWGLGPGVVVSPGGGDNMMAAIGTGNVREGIVTASLGTSGTVYACSARPVVDPEGALAAFCDATGRWLPLACTQNVTTATEMVRALFGLTHEEFDAAAGAAPPGAGGLLLLPFLEGERMPDLPDGTGVLIGLGPRTCTPAHLARAAMEGTLHGLEVGLARLRALGVAAREVRITGGGARSPVWRALAADVFDAEVVALESAEGAALGAALQASWSWRRGRGERVGVEEIADAWVRTDESTRVAPTPGGRAAAARMRELFDRSWRALAPVFPVHRRTLG
jgi:xylulokinase